MSKLYFWKIPYLSGYIVSFVLAGLLMFLCNWQLWWPGLKHLAEPPVPTLSDYIHSVSAAYGDETEGPQHLSEFVFEEEFLGRLLYGKFEGELSFPTRTQLAEEGSTAYDDLARAVREFHREGERQTAEHEVKVPAKHAVVDGPKSWSFVWYRQTENARTPLGAGDSEADGGETEETEKPDDATDEETASPIEPSVNPPPQSRAASAAKMMAVVLEIWVEESFTATRLRFQVYVVDTNGVMRARSSGSTSDLIFERSGWAFCPTRVHLSEDQIANEFLKQAKRKCEASGLVWDAPQRAEADRIKTFVQTAFLRWTDPDGKGLQHRTSTARFFNGPDYTGWVQFLTMTIALSLLLNHALKKVSHPAWKTCFPGFVNGTQPARYALWAMPTLGCLGTMIAMARVAIEIGRVDLNVVALSTFLSVAYDTTTLALIITIPLALLHAIGKSEEEESA